MASMHALVSLASALNNADADGRIVVDTAGGTLKFLLLNAAAHFAKVGRSGHLATCLPERQTASGHVVLHFVFLVPTSLYTEHAGIIPGSAQTAEVRARLSGAICVST